MDAEAQSKMKFEPPRDEVLEVTNFMISVMMFSEVADAFERTTGVLAEAAQISITGMDEKKKHEHYLRTAREFKLRQTDLSRAIDRFENRVAEFTSKIEKKVSEESS